MNIEQRLRSLELQTDVMINEKDNILVMIDDETIELHSDIFGVETHPRGDMSIQDIKDELYFRFDDSDDIHFIFITKRDDGNP